MTTGRSTGIHSEAVLATPRCRLPARCSPDKMKGRRERLPFQPTTKKRAQYLSPRSESPRTFCPLPILFEPPDFDETSLLPPVLDLPGLPFMPDEP